MKKPRPEYTPLMLQQVEVEDGRNNELPILIC
jgi:hypothetical protein